MESIVFPDYDGTMFIDPQALVDSDNLKFVILYKEYSNLELPEKCIYFCPNTEINNKDMKGFDFTDVKFPVGTHFGTGCLFDNTTKFTGADLTHVTFHTDVLEQLKKTNIHEAKNIPDILNNL